MELRGFQPIFNDEYKAYRSLQVPLDAVTPERDSYQLVGRVASEAMSAAIIDAYDLRVFEIHSGRHAIRAMLFDDGVNYGMLRFAGYEAPHPDTDELTLYPDNDNGMQILLGRYGRTQLMEGYLIDKASREAAPLESPAHLEQTIGRAPADVLPAERSF